MVVGGIYLGFANETFRRLSVSWKDKKLIVYFFEIIFWIVQTGILFYVLYQVNNGDIRFYIFLACLLGFSMYVVMFQSMYRRLLEIIIQIVKRVTYLVVHTFQVLVIEPIKWVIALVITIFMYSIHLLLNILSFLLNIVFYPIRLLFKLLEKLLPEKFLKNITKFMTFYSTIVYKLKSRVKAFVSKRR